MAGKQSVEAFAHEGGGHRWQRVPPTEKRGRVHTSTVTVAVLPVPTEGGVELAEEDLEWKAFRGSGAGGQKRNVTDSAVRVVHRPSGLSVKIESERSRSQNLRSAKLILRARLRALDQERAMAERNQSRRQQLGSGMRGDKRRTVRLQAGKVKDHVTGRSTSTRAYLKGAVDELWPA